MNLDTTEKDDVCFGANHIMLQNSILAFVAILTCGIIYFFLNDVFALKTLGVMLLLLFMYNLQVFSRQLYTIIALKLGKHTQRLKTEIGAMAASGIVTITIAIISIIRFDLFTVNVTSDSMLTLCTIIILSAGSISMVSNLIPSVRNNLSIAEQSPFSEKTKDLSSKYFYVPKIKLRILNIAFFIFPIILGGLIAAVYVSIVG